MSARANVLSRLIDRITIALLLLALGFPTYDALTRSVEERTSLREQRSLAPKPAFPDTFGKVLRWTRRFDIWFRDAFGTRDRLLTAQQWIAMRVLHADPSSRIVHGREGHLYWDPGHAREVHRGALPLTEKLLDRWVAGIEERRATCESMGARYVFALAPAKETIYPEYFPSQFSPIGPTRYDQLAERLARTSTVKFVDLRPALHAERAFDNGPDRAYSKLGSHWTHRGAGAASRVLLAALELPGLTPPPREAWGYALSEEPGESLADRTYVADLYREPLYNVFPQRFKPNPDPKQFNPDGVWRHYFDQGALNTVMEGGSPELPELVMVHDSFAALMYAYLTPHFSRIHALNQTTLPVQVVDEMRPDIVVDLYVEHVLDTWDLPPPIPALLPR